MGALRTLKWSDTERQLIGGPVEEPLACLRMLSRHFDLPFRRDVLSWRTTSFLTGTAGTVRPFIAAAWIRRHGSSRKRKPSRPAQHRARFGLSCSKHRNTVIQHRGGELSQGSTRGNFARGSLLVAHANSSARRSDRPWQISRSSRWAKSTSSSPSWRLKSPLPHRHRPSGAPALAVLPSALEINLRQKHPARVQSHQDPAGWSCIDPLCRNTVTSVPWTWMASFEGQLTLGQVACPMTSRGSRSAALSLERLNGWRSPRMEIPTVPPDFSGPLGLALSKVDLCTQQQETADVRPDPTGIRASALGLHSGPAGRIQQSSVGDNRPGRCGQSML